MKRAILVKKISLSPKDDFLQNKAWLSQLTSLQELHGVDDGMVSVYVEGHQDTGRGIEQHNLKRETRGAA